MNAILFVRLALVGATLAAEPAGFPAPQIGATAADQFISGQVTVDAHRERAEALVDSKITLQYHEMPLLDVLAGIQTKTGLNIQPETRAIEQERADALQTPVTFDVTGITVRSLLRMILRECDLAWFYRDEAIVVTTDAIAWTALETRIYPVGDLVAREDGVPPHVREIRPNGPGGQVYSEPNTAVDELIDAITATITPSHWSEAGGTASIKFVPAALALTISQRREALEEIEALLAQLRKVRQSQQAMIPQPNPNDLLVFSYAMPRHIPTWQVVSPISPLYDTNAQRYEAELKTSLANAAKTATEFATVIPQVIEPASWKTSEGKGEIFVVNDRLVVRHTMAVHRQVAKLLSDNAAPGQGSSLPAQVPISPTPGSGSF
jgi:hypothetical protein